MPEQRSVSASSGRARKISEVALISAITLAIALFSALVPVIGTFTALLSPVPFALAVTRHGLKGWLATTFITFVGALLLLGPLKAIFLAIGPGVLGGFTGLGIQMNLRGEESFSTLLLMSLLGVLISFVVAFHLSKLVLHQDVLQATFKSAEESNRLSIQILRGMGIEPNVPSFDINLAMMLLPATLLMGALTYAALTVWITLKVLSRITPEVPEFKPISRWGLSKWAMLLFIATLVSAVIPALNPDAIDIAYILTSNLFILSFFLAIVHTVAYWGRKHGFLGGLLSFILSYQIPFLAYMFCVVDEVMRLSEREGVTTSDAK